MGYATRATTWDDDESVAASDLNAEFNIPLNALSDGTKDINVAAATVTSLTNTGASTLGGAVAVTGNVSATGQMSANTALITHPDRIGDIYNLGISLASGLLSFTDRSGAALSSTNFAVVTMDSATAGVSQNIKIATPITLRDEANATNDFGAVGMGITEANDWTTDVPIAIYVVNKGGNNVADPSPYAGNSAICISRNFAMTVTPAATYIGKKGSAPATDDQNSIILLGSNYTTADYAALPVQLIGFVRARWDASDAGWTFQTLAGNDGIGPEKMRKTFATRFSMAQGQRGAATNSVFVSAGTVPYWTSNSLVESYFFIRPTGELRMVGTTRGAGAVLSNGSGAQALTIATPYVANEETTGSRYFSAGWRRLNTVESVLLGLVQDGNADINIYNEGGTTVANSAFLDGADDLSWDFTYKAF